MNWITVAVAVAVLLVVSIVFPSLFGGAWSPTSMRRVRAMLDAARLQPGETLVDLGAGDGRVIITAAREKGARAVGVEIDPLRYALCRLRIALGGLSGKASVLWSNFFDVDLRDADVVTFFLSQAAADKLAPKFRAELKPGARIVSHQRPLPGWTPVRVDEEHQLYVYAIDDEAAAGPDGRTSSTDGP